MTLGEKLRQARLDRGLTQAQAAGEQITRNMLSQIENDLAKPSVRTLEYLAAVLDADIGWLMRDDSKDAASDRMRRARACYRTGDLGRCLEMLREDAADDEAYLLIALCASELAQRALEEERFSEAQKLAQEAEKACAECPYPTERVLLQTARILLRLAEKQNSSCGDEAQRLQKVYRGLETGVQYHLTMARHHLLNGQIQDAEREIWSIGDVSDADKAEYLILRGRVAACKGQYENALVHLMQADESPHLPKILRRELYAAMELCCRQTEDFKNAYAYAAKQLELGAPI